ncbi:MAG TPA: MHYT domain-containing protein [Afifellaceae bacterium]|nr:MHYT domain-containing protein [Afifellaceae bacterium]
MLSVAYDPLLVLASVLVAIMAAFTGLRLVRGLSQLNPADRRPRIAQAAIALGGGIWSMHFVGMLAMRLPVAVSYDALPTLASVLIAILVTGIGLIVLHFGPRNQARIIAAGTLIGLGIVSMHYVGMSAISGNTMVTYTPAGIALSTAIGIGAAILALELAYRRRMLAMTALGAVALGMAISAMHYVAMIFTRFHRVDSIEAVAQPALSSGMLALIVSIAAFLICGFFLMMAIPLESRFAEKKLAASNAAGAAGHENDAMHGGPRRKGETALSTAYARGGPNEHRQFSAYLNRIPYERENTVRFFATEQISAIRADGHYTRVMNAGGEFFCPWSISRVEQAITSPPFIRTHRSYLVNLAHVDGFRREGDRAYCFMSEHDDIRIPVSRSRIGDVQRALGLS